ncbi:hypothetical protein EON83_07320 [bacterium]|nr:MAG: hypothetical protein EON83_07320 [bacterium]
MHFMKTVRFKRSLLLLPLVAGLAFGAFQCRAARADFLLKANDRVVFYGDSITDFHNYTRPFQDYVYARYPDRHIHFYNAGWSGDQAGGALRRLNRDVLVLNPTVVTLCFGMNDGHYTTVNDEIVNTYRTNMDGIVKALTDKGIRVIVFSPPPVDYESDKNHQPLLRDVKYNENLVALSNAASEVAKKYGATYIDILHPMLSTHEALKAKAPGYTMIPDSVHPDEKGGVVMAGAMLLGMGAEQMPMLADINAMQLTDGKATIQGPIALPMWMNPESAVAARESGFLNVAGQRVRVRGLAPGSYDVRINDRSQGWFSNTQLEAGILVPGTYSTRAQRLYDVTWWKGGSYFNTWRNLRIGSEQGAPIDAAVAAMMKADDAYHDAIEALNAPADSLVLTVQPTGLPGGLGQNLALKKPYTVSDPNGYNFGIGNLTNGVWESGDGDQKPFATGDKDAFPKNATIDLGKATPISHVLLGVPAFGSTKTVLVSVSSDGQNFTEVGSYTFSKQKEERHVYSFAATPARYVRVSYPDHYPDTIGYSPTFAFTTEVEVYGPAQ